MKYLVSILIISILSTLTYAQQADTTKTFIDKTKIQIKLTDAKHKF